MEVELEIHLLPVELEHVDLHLDHVDLELLRAEQEDVDLELLRAEQEDEEELQQQQKVDYFLVLDGQCSPHFRLYGPHSLGVKELKKVRVSYRQTDLTFLQSKF